MKKARSMLTHYVEKNCQRCPRLAAFRAQNRIKFPDQWNSPVPSFGPENAELLILGLAPGLKGANFSGRPFTGDYAGDLLYATLLKFGFATGSYEARADDGLDLVNCRITNAVRCVPPENKPTGEEEKACLPFLKTEFSDLKHLKIVLTLGLIAHKSFLRSHGLKQSAYKFGHGAVHHLDGLIMVNSYHCSRYNTQTKRLTTPMFEDIFQIISDLLRSTP